MKFAPVSRRMSVEACRFRLRKTPNGIVLYCLVSGGRQQKSTSIVNAKANSRLQPTPVPLPVDNPEEFELDAPIISTGKILAFPGGERRAENPYRLPDDGNERVINFSGGRSSAYMLYHILRAHNGRVPDTARVLFCNTGREREETLKFVHEIGQHMGVPIVWLEYNYRFDAKGGKDDLKNIHRIVDFETASRKGEPFEELIRSRKMLPNQDMRLCTQELKVETVNRYMRRDLDIRNFRNVLGIRYDEPKRWHKALLEECTSDYPMVHAGVSKADIKRFWDAQDYDLGIPSWMGNCRYCFLKGVPNLMHTIRLDTPADPKAEHPVQWWKDMEKVGLLGTAQRNLRDPAMAFFSKRHSFEQLEREALQTLGLDGDSANFRRRRNQLLLRRLSREVLPPRKGAPHPHSPYRFNRFPTAPHTHCSSYLAGTSSNAIFADAKAECLTALRTFESAPRL